MYAHVDDDILRFARSLFDVPGEYGSAKRHFTFIIRGKKTVMCLGWNKARKTHPLAAKYHYRFECLHSEVDAINKFQYPISDLKHYKMVNIRLLANGASAISRPCINCRRLLRDFGVRYIIYSVAGDKFVKEYL